jgi:hypothetical protein
LFDLRNRVQLFSGYSYVYRAAAISLILIFFTGNLLYSNFFYGLKVFPIGKDKDQFYGFDPYFWKRGIITKITLDYINEEIDKEDDFVVFPRGVMLNYLSRRENKTGYTFLDPFAVDLLGEDKIINSLQTTRPTYIILVNWTFTEFDRPYFGRDFGQSIYAWILANYKTTKIIGAKIIEEEGPGFQIMKRN